jgi:hypothetical protein
MLTAADRQQINAGIAKFNAAASTGDNQSSSAGAATDEAGTLTALAVDHIGTPLSTKLVAASSAWGALSSAILAGNQRAVTEAKASVESADQGLIG